eukprot:2280942-Ditylum_brightwellii.AAC.1
MTIERTTSPKRDQSEDSAAEANFSSGDRQAQETIDERSSSIEVNIDFAELAKPKKNGQTRGSTEYHATKFFPCFKSIVNEMEIDDIRDEEEDESKEDDDSSMLDAGSENK